MKPTIKLPFKEFMANAIGNLDKTTHLNIIPGTYKLMKKSSFDGPTECYDVPEYIEIEIEIENPKPL